MITGKEKIRCGLIGEKLSHSFSPKIHSYLADYSYELFEISANEIGDFLKSDRFDSVNITIPYKKAVMPFLDEISDDALRIGSVNTITRTENGGLRGDNTDYFGFSYLLRKSRIDVLGKKVLILGTGGASLTANAVCQDLGAQSIKFVSRTGRVNYQNIYDICSDAEIIINCTPVGMYPNNLTTPIDLFRFQKLCGVVDMIYNPAKTKLLLDAQRLGIKCANGLSMLVAQAKRACELFTDEQIDDREIDRITSIIESETMNIILVGMPGCGKSTVATLLSELMGRELIDTDSLIVSREERSIPEIFALDGEQYFRKCESIIAADIGKLSGKIISTGGGIVTQEDNFASLAQNGKVFFIQRELSLLAKDGRPLSLETDLEQMYEKRLPLYLSFADYTVDNSSSVRECADNIINLFLCGGAT